MSAETRRVFAIETSCDETAAAVLEGFGTVIAHEVFTQAAMHAQFGGVVPEVASRSHLESLPWVCERVFEKCPPSAIDVFAGTTGPGLAAALLVGASAAKGLALGARKPFVAVNHIEGHLLSPFFGCAGIPPHVGLVVSGGHTLLFDVEAHGRYRLLGRTRDDAAGEAFDKVAKLLGLGYPGGVEIDRLAAAGNPARFSFPRGMIDSGDFAFSFSGLKTAVRTFLERGASAADLPDICASFQQAVVDVLVAKLLAAAESCGRGCIALSGGVSMNRALRTAVMAKASGLDVRFAPDGLRTDNALMIAFAAAHRFASSGASPLATDIAPNLNPADLCV